MSSSNLPAFVPSFSCSDGITPENIEVLRIHAAKDVDAAAEHMRYAVRDGYASAEQIINAAYLLAAARALVGLLYADDPSASSLDIITRYAGSDSTASAAIRAAAAFVLKQSL